MFPIRDHNPSERTPYVTLALIAINVVIFLSYFPILGDARASTQVFLTWGLVPAELSSGGGVANIFTSMFLHGGIMHLLGNMLFLWVFGDNLEDELGHGTFLGFYLLSGMGAGLAQVISAPNSPIPMVGASGAIAGVLGGYLLLYPKARVDVLFIIVIIFKIIPIPAGIVLTVWFAMQVFSGAATPAGSGGVAYWAHAGGFLAGLVMILPLWLKLGGPGFWRRTHGHPDHPEARYRRVSTRIPKVRRRR
ncbi:rhomboid family intramembrane serine protease [Dinoroseobacter sp. S124A]|uniref:rhomboid family intramembrane serine protease n=1 Tax=Dinoroseobacter sp. S124A TaxID=3415128 RepID=UPI003C7E7909